MIEIGSTLSEKLDFVYAPLHPLIMTDKPLFLILAAIIVFIILLVRRKRWAEFAIRYKWRSRIILSFLMFVLAIFLPIVSGWSSWHIPVRFAFESPNLTATAIKIGLYGLYVGHEESRMLPEEKPLLNCVDAVSRAEAQKYQNTCGNDRACFENIPAMTRKDIISKIRESQKTVVPLVSPACKNVDIAKM